MQHSLLLFLGSASEAAVPDSFCVIIHGNAVFNENSLHKAVSRRKLYGFSFLGIIGNPCEDMAFVVRIKIVAVNDPYRIIQLQAVFKAKAASGIEL